MLSLPEIVENEEMMILDTSLSGGNDFGWNTYEANKYEDLSSDLLKKELEEVIIFKKLLENSSSNTIWSITEEIKKYEEIINEKIRYLSENSLNHYNKNRGKEKRERRSNNRKEKRERKNSNVKSLLIKLQNETYKARRLSENKELEIKDPRYNILLEMTKLVSREAKLKKDKKYALGKRNEDRSYDSDTDEKLTACLYYQSLFSDKNPSLITKDTDFVFLLEIATRLIGSDVFLPYNESFRKRILENPFKLYLRGNGEYELRETGKNMSYTKTFEIYNLSEERNQQVQQEIEEKWKLFYSHN